MIWLFLTVQLICVSVMMGVILHLYRECCRCREEEKKNARMFGQSGIVRWRHPDDPPPYDLTRSNPPT
jgi:hypothetical protein